MEVHSPLQWEAGEALDVKESLKIHRSWQPGGFEAQASNNQGSIKISIKW